jgi:DNA-directed RNA polymerase subunit RPC12/RpoP
MSVRTIPDRVPTEHPEMASAFEALMEYSEGREISMRCPRCNHRLVVTDLPDVGSRWVTCDSGCTSYHEKYQPKGPQVA